MIGPRERRPASASEDWVSRLPELIEGLWEDWSLSLDGERMVGSACNERDPAAPRVGVTSRGAPHGLQLRNRKARRARLRPSTGYLFNPRRLGFRAGRRVRSVERSGIPTVCRSYYLSAMCALLRVGFLS